MVIFRRFTRGEYLEAAKILPMIRLVRLFGFFKITVKRLTCEASEVIWLLHSLGCLIFCAPEHDHDLGLGKTCLLHRNLLVHAAEKILLPHPLNIGGITLRTRGGRQSAPETNPP